jgi:hypothetical protein
MTSKINIPAFDIKSLLPDATLLIIGARRSGKSVLLRDIFYHHQEIPQVIVFSATETASPFFSRFIPDSFIYNKYMPSKINKCINRQKILIGKNGKTEQNNIAIVLDDMMHDVGAWNKDEGMMEMFFNGRHYNMFLMLSLQYSMALPPKLKSNLDYVFVFKETSFKNKKKLHDDYGGMIRDFSVWCNLLDQITDDFGCLVIKTTGKTAGLYWYKASLHDDFKVGKDIMWKYHDKHYNKSHNKETTLKQKELLELQKKYKNVKDLKVVISKTTGKIKEITK